MRLAIDARSLMEGRHSGVEEYTTQLVRALRQTAPAGWQLVLFYNSLKPVRLPRFDRDIEVQGLRLPNKIFNLSQWALSRPRWDKLVPADCFLVPNVRLVPLSFNVPLIVTAHDLSFERFPEFYSWRRRLWHRFVRPRWLMREADAMIAVSHSTAADLAELYQIPADKINVIHSGISESLPATPAQISAVKRKYSLPEKFVLYLGTLEPRKNIPSIVRAFDAIAGSVSQYLVIAGSPGWLGRDLQNAIERARSKLRIHLTGFVEEADKKSLYAAADLFVYPSFYEGFGFPPLEALAAGTPVITSFNSSLPEVVGRYATLIDPYQPAELALTMKELLQKPARVPREVGREVLDKYSWIKAARETWKVIEKVV